MGNIIIQTRLKRLTATKRHLLSLKKDQRGNGLKEVNGKIARLKRWQSELDFKGITVKVIISTEKAVKAFETINKGIEGMKKSLSKACEIINKQIDDDFVNLLKLEYYEIEFIEALAKSKRK